MKFLLIRTFGVQNSRAATEDEFLYRINTGHPIKTAPKHFKIIISQYPFGKEAWAPSTQGNTFAQRTNKLKCLNVQWKKKRHQLSHSSVCMELWSLHSKAKMWLKLGWEFRDWTEQRHRKAETWGLSLKRTERKRKASRTSSLLSQYGKVRPFYEIETQSKTKATRKTHTNTTKTHLPQPPYNGVTPITSVSTPV